MEQKNKNRINEGKPQTSKQEDCGFSLLQSIRQELAEDEIVTPYWTAVFKTEQLVAENLETGADGHGEEPASGIFLNINREVIFIKPC